MAKPTKRRIEASSSDAKGPAPTKRTASKGDGQTTTSRRYTPPTPNTAQLPSPMWVPVLMFSFFGVGFLAIFLNYTEILPGAPSGWWLIGGLGAILAGIVTATQLR